MLQLILSNKNVLLLDTHMNTFPLECHTEHNLINIVLALKGMHESVGTEVYSHIKMTGSTTHTCNASIKVRPHLPPPGTGGAKGGDFDILAVNDPEFGGKIQVQLSSNPLSSGHQLHIHDMKKKQKHCRQ